MLVLRARFVLMRFREPIVLCRNESEHSTENPSFSQCYVDMQNIKIHYVVLQFGRILLLRARRPYRSENFGDEVFT